MGLLQLINCRISWLCFFVSLTMPVVYGQSNINKNDSLSSLITTSNGVVKYGHIYEYIKFNKFDIGLDSLADEMIAMAKSSELDSLIGESYLLKAHLYVYQNQKVDEAISLFEIAFNYFDKGKWRDKQVQTAAMLTARYIQVGDLVAPDSFIQMSLDIKQSSKLTNKSLYALSRARASHYTKKKDKLKALEAYLEGEQYADTSNIVKMASNYNNMANLYMSLKRDQDAMKYYNLAISYYRRNKEKPFNVAYAYDGISILYHRLGHRDTLRMYLDSAIFHSQKLGSKRKLASLYNRKSVLLKEDNKLQEALIMAQLARSTYGSSITPNGAVYNDVIQGEIYNDLGQHKKALKICSELLPKTKEIINKNMYRLACNCLMNANIGMGRYEEALDFSNRRYASLDTSRQYLHEREVAQLEAKYQIEKEQKTQELKLEKEQVAYAIDLQRRKNTRNYLLLGLGAAGFLSFFLHRSNRRRKEINQLLQEKQEITASALQEKDTLLREIHHRVKNNLQVISSLLFIQSQNFESEEVKQAIDQSRNRVRSMALIHQNLYQRDNLSGVPVRKYFEKLVRELFEAYDVSSDRVSFSIDIDDLDLDVETMVPIGLVCNELISNALKHAFPGGRSGTLKVRIKEVDDLLKVEIEDDGIGNSMEQSQASNSMGKRLVELFCKKLNADINYDFSKGTIVQILIKAYHKTGG